MAKPQFLFWILILTRSVRKLFRVALLVAGVYFVLEGPWINGVGCFAILVLWKLDILQDRVEAIRDHLRGLSDDDIYEALKRGDIELMKTKGHLQEAIVILRDIRNNQMNASPPRGDGGTF
jgi:hypothetical protein